MDSRKKAPATANSEGTLVKHSPGNDSILKTDGVQAIVFDHSPLGEIAHDTLDVLRRYRSNGVNAVVIKVSDSTDIPQGMTEDEALGFQEILYTTQAEIEEFCDKVAEGIAVSDHTRAQYRLNLARARKIREVLKHGRPS